MLARLENHIGYTVKGGRKMRCKVVFVALLLLFFITLVPSAHAAKVNLTAISASPGGSWFAVMGATAELVHEKDPSISIKATPGSGAANALAVAMGTKAQLGFTFPPFAIAALEGTEPFEGRPKAEKLRAIHAGFGLSPIQFVVRKEFADKYGIKSLKDISDKKVPIRIVTDNPGTSDEFVGRKLLEYYGATYNEIKKWGGSITLTGYTDAVQLIQDGHADMAINNIIEPSGPFVEMQLNVPLEHLSLDEGGIQYAVDELAHIPHIISKGTYKGQENDIHTVGMYSVHVVNADVPEDVVYRITKIICENVDDFRSFSVSTKVFNPKTAFEGCGIMLHPGAERYYKEMGYVK